MAKYGYARVSTNGQATKGNSLEEQMKQLKAEGCEFFYEDKFTGTKSERPNFTKLLRKLEEGDTLVVTKLDRFARSTVGALKVVSELNQRGVKVHILNMGLVENTPTGKLIFTVMAAFAEFERDMIIERAQEGKAIAKQREDFREGRPPKFKKKQIELALELLEKHTYKEVEERTGISKSTLVREKRKLQSNSEVTIELLN